MIYMKKLLCSILLAALVLVFPTQSFAEVTQSEGKLNSTASSSGQHVTVNIPLEITDNSVSNSVYGDFSTQKTKVLYATLDF
ncbi:hypothetical protein [Paenibacillus terrae]|uniref:Uncharacterized protein n=1 Tax=Paenibacillus terrae TaxID=159743 RepID=A0A0D7X569_9BACL|nr:hypothetical protein [Paenibacillus terrae]KJD45172.1 hypothetical protein QD47_12950 [Paenibacillus terrae]